MATYADVADFEAYSLGETVTDPTALEAYLVQAEKYVDDLIVGGGARVASTGRLFDPGELSAFRAACLRDATCAQAEYMLKMGPDFHVKDQHEQISGPDFSVTGKLSRYAPKAREEVRRAGLSAIWGTAGVGRRLAPTLAASRRRVW